MTIGQYLLKIALNGLGTCLQPVFMEEPKVNGLTKKLRYTQQRHAVSNVNRLKKPGLRYQIYRYTYSDWREYTAQGAARFPK